MPTESEQPPNTLEEIISNAKEIMLRRGNHVPTLIMEVSKDLVVSEIPSMPVTHGERLEFMRFIGQRAAQNGRFDQLQQVFLVSEGWLSEAIADLPPSQDP